MGECHGNLPLSSIFTVLLTTNIKFLDFTTKPTHVNDKTPIKQTATIDNSNRCHHPALIRNRFERDQQGSLLDTPQQIKRRGSFGIGRIPFAHLPTLVAPPDAIHSSIAIDVTVVVRVSSPIDQLSLRTAPTVY